MDAQLATKHCPRCQETKPLEAFYKDVRRTDGHFSICMECAKAARRESRASATTVVVSPMTTPVSRWNQRGRVCDGCSQPERAQDSQGRTLPLSLYGNDAQGSKVTAVLCKLCSMGLACARDDPGIVGRWLGILSVGVRHEVRIHVDRRE